MSPYFIKKAQKKKGYYVMDTSGQYYEKEPIPLARAKKQLVALHINTGHGLRGSGTHKDQVNEAFDAALKRFDGVPLHDGRIRHINYLREKIIDELNSYGGVTSVLYQSQKAEIVHQGIAQLNEYMRLQPIDLIRQSYGLGVTPEAKAPEAGAPEVSTTFIKPPSIFKQGGPLGVIPEPVRTLPPTTGDEEVEDEDIEEKLLARPLLPRELRSREFVGHSSEKELMDLMNILKIPVIIDTSSRFTSINLHKLFKDNGFVFFPYLYNTPGDGHAIFFFQDLESGKYKFFDPAGSSFEHYLRDVVPDMSTKCATAFVGLNHFFEQEGIRWESNTRDYQRVRNYSYNDCFRLCFMRFIFRAKGDKAFSDKFDEYTRSFQEGNPDNSAILQKFISPLLKEYNKYKSTGTVPLELLRFIYNQREEQEYRHSKGWR